MPLNNTRKPSVSSPPQLSRRYISGHAIGPTLLEQLEQRRADNQRMYHQNRRPGPRPSTQCNARRSMNSSSSRAPDDEQRGRQGQLLEDGTIQRSRRMGVAVPPMPIGSRRSTAALGRVDERWQGGHTTNPETSSQRLDEYQIGVQQLRSLPHGEAVRANQHLRLDSASPPPRPLQRRRRIPVESCIEPRFSSQTQTPRHQAILIHSISAEAASQRFTVDAPLRIRRQNCNIADTRSRAPAVQPPVRDVLPQFPTTATTTSSFQVLNRRPLTRPVTPPADLTAAVSCSAPLSPRLRLRWPFLDSPPQIDDADFSYRARLARATSPFTVLLAYRRRRCSCRTQASTTTASTWTRYTRDPATRLAEHDCDARASTYYCRCAIDDCEQASSSYGGDATYDDDDSKSACAVAVAAVQVPTQSGGRRISGHFRVGEIWRGSLERVDVQAVEEVFWDELEGDVELCCGEADGGYTYGEGEAVFEGPGLMA